MSIAEHLGNMFFKVINQTKVEILKANKQASHAISAETWSSLVVGDEQLDRTNSQTCMELCHECVAHFFLGGGLTYTNSFPLGPKLPSSPTSKELHGCDVNRVIA